MAATKQRMRLEIKEISTEGAFEGLLSPYGNIDGGGDVVEAGAFTKTLQEHGNKVPLLWQHNPALPIGELTLEDRPEGLWCKGQLLMADNVAQRAYLFIKAKIVKGLSIGFDSVRDTLVNGIRSLKEIRLYEGSIVTFPMNESALISAVKGKMENKGDFNEELVEVQLWDGQYQMRCALASALSDAIYADGLTKEQKVTLAETVIQQFSDAWLAWLPQYLDMLAEYAAENGMEYWSRPGMEQKRRGRERKEGRMISSANKDNIKSACEHMLAAHEIMSALIADDAGGDATSDAGAAVKSKPGNHLAAQILEIRSLIPQAQA